MHLKPPCLIVLCARPGLIRGGHAHPAMTSHAPGAFTEAQLREMLAEPAIRIAFGSQILAEDIPALLAAEAEQKAALEAEVTKVEEAAAKARGAKPAGAAR